MKISQLIHLLEQTKERHGDLEIGGCLRWFEGWETLRYRILSFVRVENNRCFIVFRKMGWTEWRIWRSK